MAFTLRIKKTGLFGNKTISLQEIVQNCGFKYGVYNDFYVLDEDQDRNGSCILYNPQHIGRGISISNYGSEVEIRHNIPTTASEIADFVKLLAEIKRQYGKCEIRDKDSGKVLPFEAFADEIPAHLIELSSKEIIEGAKQGKEYGSWILTLAKWPFFADDEMIEEMSQPGKAQRFAEILHEKQNIDAYYAKPHFYRNSVDNSTLAGYTYTEECTSIFPTDFNCFIDANNPTQPFKADKGMISFFIFSEKRTLDGIYDYDKFIKYVMEHGATKYDANHILLPEYTKEQILEIAEACEMD